ncbi:nuclear transport factor 2 family protein [Terrisporobacter sp.]
MTNEEYDFTDFSKVEITGIDIDKLNDTEFSILYQAARYCQAMTDADTDTMREIVSEDMIFTHMSGRQQTREEYFADIEDGSLRYYTIKMEKPRITIYGDSAVVAYTSVLNANAYGARGTFRMSGNHCFENRDGIWYEVNRP